LRTALDPEPGGLRWIAVGLFASLGLHVAVAGGIGRIPERAANAAQWVEMAVTEVQPEPPPPAPEPEPEVVKPETVDYQKQVEPPPEPQPVQPVVKTITQGLSNESFLPGAGTGLQVRQGNTTAAKATPDQTDGQDSVVVPYASVTVPPKIRYKPTLDVPAAVKERKVQGRVELILTVDETGKVSAIEVLERLDPDADEACRKALLTSRWKPGEKDGVPVITRNVPYSCKFEMSLD
jgi:TonB family protein